MEKAAARSLYITHEGIRIENCNSCHPLRVKGSGKVPLKCWRRPIEAVFLIYIN